MALYRDFRIMAATTLNTRRIFEISDYHTSKKSKRSARPMKKQFLPGRSISGRILSV